MADADVSDETTTTDVAEEDDLELSLSLRPLNCSQKLLESSSNEKIISKRDAQALRRHEAKLKRDFKRKSSSPAKINQEQRRKLLNLGFQGAVPPWFGWNNAGAGFPPYQGYNGNFISHEGKEAGTSVSSGSSSEISDNYHSISGPGGSSSDAGSHSSHSHSPLPPPNVPSTSTTSQLQPCSSQLDLQFNGYNPYPNLSKPQLCSSQANKIELVAGLRQSSKSPEELTSLNMACQQNGAQSNNDKTLSDNDPNSTPRSTIPKEAKGEIGKPPKPVGRMDQQKLLVSQMPCVSTTGNGPNGKTLTGFLYKYTKTEVSIICVCHGTSFSPAGFVEHAGGVDVEYPLKQIRVVPFALG